MGFIFHNEEEMINWIAFIIYWIEKHLTKILLVIIVIQLWIAIDYLHDIEKYG
jgi:hypothetical protein